VWTGGWPVRAVVATAVATAAAGTTWAANRDVAADLGAILGPVWSAAAGIGPVTIGALLGVCLVHYLAAAIAARAAAGTALPFGELVAAQLAASAANRITPAGLGGSTVTARYFVRRGGLAPAAAAAGVSSLALLGGLADAVGLALVIALGTALGAPGASGEIPLLVGKVIALVPRPTSVWLLVGLPLFAALAVTGFVLRGRWPSLGRQAGRAVRTYLRTLASFARQPGRLVMLLLASASTTVALAAGFAVVAVAPASGLPATEFGALMVGFMIASAAASAVPTPGGIGAVATVTVFRLVTFWAPAVTGIGAARALRRRGAL
jgi:uncharacterized membrane protein YbhN (UPF0104 family)